MPNYSRKAKEAVGSAMHRMKRGALRTARGKKKVTNGKQAIVIGLSEARKKGARVPEKNT